MSAQLAPSPVFQAFTQTGAPLVAGKLFTFAAGTNTPQATYIDSTQTTQNTNPVILSSLGTANVWLNPGLAYKFVLQDAAGNQIYSVDNILGALSQPNIVIGPPASGTALTVLGANPATAFSTQMNFGPLGITNNGLPLIALNSTGAGYSLIQNDSALNWSIAYTPSNVPFSLGTPIIRWNSNGNVVIAQPPSGAALTVNGGANGATGLVVIGNGSVNPALAITNVNVPGQSTGLSIFAGTNAADTPLYIQNAAPSGTQLMALNGLGAMAVGNITPQIAGSINAVGGYYTNNVKQPIWAAPLAGFGTPTGNVVVANFSGAAATLVQCSNTIAQILLTLKAAGVYAA